MTRVELPVERAADRSIECGERAGVGACQVRVRVVKEQPLTDGMPRPDIHLSSAIWTPGAEAERARRFHGDAKFRRLARTGDDDFADFGPCGDLAQQI